MKIFQIVFNFMDPTQAMATIEAETPEKAEENLRSIIEEKSPGIENLTIESIEEIFNLPNIEMADLSADRTLN